MAKSGGLTVTKKDAGLQIKTTEFSGFLRTLREKLGDQTDMRTIVDYEMGRVLNRALALTARADETKIREKWKGKRAVTLLGKKVWLASKTGRKYKLPDALWAQVESARATGLARTLARVGAAKASWLAIAEKLGQEITAPSYVKNVMLPGGIERLGKVERRGDGNSYGVAIRNYMSKLSYTPPGGREALFSAFAGRIGFYRTNMAKGVFDSAVKIAAKYKGVIVRPNS